MPDPPRVTQLDARALDLDAQPVRGQQVEVLAASGAALGRSTGPTDDEGLFQLSVDEDTLRGIRAGDAPPVHVRLFDPTGATAYLEDDGSTWEIDGKLIIRIGLRGDELEIRSVAGTVRRRDGRALEGVRVVALDRDLGDDVPLGETQTDADGAYEIGYRGVLLRLAGKPHADLVVRATTGDERRSPLGEAVVPGAGVAERAEIEASAPPDEYGLLAGDLARALGTRALHVLTDADAAKVARRARTDPERTVMIVRAARLGNELELPTAALYALARRDVPLEAPAVTAREPKDVVHGLREAAEAGIAPEAIAQQATVVAEKLRSMAGGYAPLRDLAEAAGIDGDHPLLERLARGGVATLDDLRRRGGVDPGLATADEDRELAARLDAHVRLSALPLDPGASAALIDAGMTSVGEIARVSPERLVADVGGQVDAAVLEDAHAAATAQAWTLANALTEQRATADGGNGARARMRTLVPPLCDDRACRRADSPLAYLADLLDFALHRLTHNGVPVTLSSLEARLRQPLRDLPATCEAMDARVRQVRIAVEALRREVPAAATRYTPQNLLGLAYQRILEGLGTSYAELRAAQSWPAREQAELTARLGIRIAGQAPGDALAELFADPADATSLTEEFLEGWFGLRDTRRPPLEEDAHPILNDRRRAGLRDEWYAEDWPAAPSPRTRAFVDPDVVGPADMVYAVLTRPDQRPRTPNQPIHLWEDRNGELARWKLDCLDVRIGLPDPEDAIDAFVSGEAFANNRIVPVPIGLGIPLGDFPAYRERLLAGEELSAALEPYAIDQDGFAALVRVWDTVKATPRGEVLAAEWDDLDNVLIERQKVLARPRWRTEERAISISLSPEFFKLRDPGDPTATWYPHARRAPAAVRAAWLRVLRSRIDRQETMEEGLGAIVEGVEQPVLVELRDELIRQVAMPGTGLVRKRELLEQRLQMDLQESGERITTRIAQAIEAIQGLLFGARNGLLEDPGFALGGAHFDEEWRWIGSYAAWSSAMQVFMHPEIALRPTLRTRQSPAFAALVDALRDAGWQPGASVVGAEVRRYEAYFRDLCTLSRAAVARTTGLLGDAGDVPPPTGAQRWSETGDILAVAQGASGAFYASTWRRRPGWGLGGSPDQTHWTRFPVVAESIVVPGGTTPTVAGVLPYPLTPGRAALGLYCTVRLEDGTTAWSFTAFDGTSWSAPRPDGAPYTLIRTDAAEVALPASSRRRRSGAGGWTFGWDDRYVPADLDGDGRSEIVAIGPPRTDGTRALGLFREEAGGLTLDRLVTIPAGFAPPSATRPPVLRIGLAASPYSADRVVLLDRSTSRLGLVSLSAQGDPVLTIQDSAAVGTAIDPDATYIAADIDGNGRTELIAFDYRTVMGVTEHGTANVAMPMTRATVFRAGEAGLSQRFQQDLTPNPNNFGAPVTDQWTQFEPVRQRNATGTFQDGLVIRANHAEYSGAGNVVDHRLWVAVLMWNPFTDRFDPIVATQMTAQGLVPWDWQIGDEFIALDTGTQQPQQLVVRRRSSTGTDPVLYALLERQADGILRVSRSAEGEIPAPAGAGVDPWSRTVGERWLRADVDGDGLHELVVVGMDPERIGVLRWSGSRLEVRWTADARVDGPGGAGIWNLGLTLGYLKADLDGDGCEELVSWQPGQQLAVLRSFAPPVSATFGGQAVPARYGPRGVRDTNLDPPRNAAATELRRTLVRDAYAAQPLAGDSNTIYLDEAFYFLPVEIAIRLREAGDYTGALDWLRAVYDHRLAPDQRLIAHKLVLDAGTTTPQRPEDWLRDPLDPHGIAETRRNSYLRFTILAVAGCLLDFADAEYTRATSESLPRARELYLEALELVNLPVLRQEANACAGMIGSLTIDIGESEYLWLRTEIKRQLGKLQDPDALQAAVGEIDAIFTADEPVPARLARAQRAVEKALAAMPDAPTFEAMLAEDADRRRGAELALLAEPDLARAARRAGAAVQRVPILERGPLAAELRTIDSIYSWQLVPAPALTFFVPANPLIDAARAYAELCLHKLRNNRSIAGFALQVTPYELPRTATLTGLGTGDALPEVPMPAIQPLPYRYATLIERAKELVRIAQQLEAALLGALLSRDEAAYEVLRARQDLDVAEAGVGLKTLQVTEATHAVTLAELQRDRSDIQRQEFDRLLRQGVSGMEQASLAALGVALAFQGVSAASSASAAVAKGWSISAIFSTWGNVGSELASAFSSLAAAAGTTSQMFGTSAAWERRREEWLLQRALATQDVRIGAQQVVLARDRLRISAQDRAISVLQAGHAEAMLDFIDTKKFGTYALYDWMAGVLGQIYRYFLQQAATTARLAQGQLAFERQELPTARIAADYWEPPTRPASTRAGSEPTDVQGMTGSERLLRDLYELDQFAFSTNRRRLQLAETVSLAQLDPFAFEQLRATGVMRFATPTSLFDASFPGHYLRLVHRVRLSVVALIPPARGIRATLATTGLSRVVTGPPTFETVAVPRGPESVSLVAPTNATGLFELDPQPDVLAPFEGIGVDTGWELRLPKAANPFDFGTLADILMTIEYTALESDDLRARVLRAADPAVVADRAFSLRSHFPDAWYELNNPELSDTPMIVRFDTAREDFPPQPSELAIRHVLVFFPHDGNAFAPVALRYLEFGGVGRGSTAATDAAGVVSTRRGNAPAVWGQWIGDAPFGTWELALTDTPAARARFAGGEIPDVLLVVTFDGVRPAWPA